MGHDPDHPPLPPCYPGHPGHGQDPASDDYIDKILENLRNLVIENNMDPMELPDLETGFSDTILGITWHGSAKLKNGHFWGLSTLARTGDTSFTVEGDKARLTAYIGIRGASAHYDASAEFMGITVSAKATADISDIQIFLDAEMVLTGGSGLKLKDFQVTQTEFYNSSQVLITFVDQPP